MSTDAPHAPPARAPQAPGPRVRRHLRDRRRSARGRWAWPARPPSVAQGPRATSVQVDPAAAAAASGSRLIVTTSQSLAEVDASQVTVTPATPFTVDTSGRSVGVRFMLPLFDDTEYTVTFADVQGRRRRPRRRPSPRRSAPRRRELFLLQRTTSGDTIFRTDLTGEEAVPVFTPRPHRGLPGDLEPPRRLGARRRRRPSSSSPTSTAVRSARCRCRARATSPICRAPTAAS